MNEDTLTNQEMEAVMSLISNREGQNTTTNVETADLLENDVEMEDKSKEADSEVNGSEEAEELIDVDTNEISTGEHQEKQEHIANKTSADSVSSDKNEQKTKHPTRIPLARIKNMMKMDPDVQLLSQDSVFLVTKATELFIEYIAKEAAQNMASGKRKTLLRKDIDSVIDSKPHLCFLDGVFE